MEPWIIRSKVRPKAHVRLICLPFPGGSISTFEKWHHYFPETIEIGAVQLPGRQKRIRESPLRDVKDAADQLVSFMSTRCDCPIAVMGNCASSFLAFEFCRRIQNLHDIQPVHLFVTSCRAPNLPNSTDIIYNLPDSRLKKKLIELGMVPEWLQKNDKVFSNLLPLMRVDFEMAETYTMQEWDTLDCPLTAFSGNTDPMCTFEELEAWKYQTKGDFRMKVFGGGHNILESHLAQIIDIIKEDLGLMSQ